LYRREQSRGKKDPPNFQEGDQVLVRRIKKYTPGLIPKLLSKWTGPFEVIQKYGNKSYQLKAQSGQLLKSPVNIERIKEYKCHDEMSDQDENISIPEGFVTESVPDLRKEDKRDTPELLQSNASDQSDVLYEIEKILRKRKRKGIKEVLIKWKGYPRSQSSWEPEENVQVLQGNLSSS